MCGLLLLYVAVDQCRGNVTKQLLFLINLQDEIDEKLTVVLAMVTLFQIRLHALRNTLSLAFQASTFR